MWTSEVEDYCEVVRGGMKEALEAVKGQKEEVEDRHLEAHWWKERSELWRFLKRYTEGEAKKIVSGIKKDNGWEAWRKLHQQYEPGSTMREAVARSQFTGMVNKRSKTPKETRALMVKL